MDTADSHPKDNEGAETVKTSTTVNPVANTQPLDASTHQASAASGEPSDALCNAPEASAHPDIPAQSSATCTPSSSSLVATGPSSAPKRAAAPSLNVQDGDAPVHSKRAKHNAAAAMSSSLRNLPPAQAQNEELTSRLLPVHPSTLHTIPNMPTFKTPYPVSLIIRVLYAEVVVTAADGGTETDSTTVTISPSDPRNSKDVDEANSITVEHKDTEVLITAPPATMFSALRRGTAIVTVTCPRGSSVDATNRKGAMRLRGDVTTVVLESGNGVLDITSAHTLTAHTLNGKITVGTVHGSLDVTSNSGKVDVGHAHAGGRVKTSNGAITVKSAGDSISVETLNGAIDIGSAATDVEAKTNNGAVSLKYIVKGRIDAKSNSGAISVGVSHDTSVTVDAHTNAGRVTNNVPSDTKKPYHADLYLRTNAGSIRVDQADLPAAGMAGPSSSTAASGSEAAEEAPPSYNETWSQGKTAPAEKK